MYEELVKKAKEAMKNSYSPYSKFRVGAAVLAASGKIYTGVNIENAAYWPSLCAERTAIFKAVSEGERKFKAIAVVVEGNEPSAPCGGCRQVLHEFSMAGDDIDVVMSCTGGKVVIKKLSELLPLPFGSEVKKDE
jgi:cytidine deaminase